MPLSSCFINLESIYRTILLYSSWFACAVCDRAYHDEYKYRAYRVYKWFVQKKKKLMRRKPFIFPQIQWNINCTPEVNMTATPSARDVGGFKSFQYLNARTYTMYKCTTPVYRMCSNDKIALTGHSYRGKYRRTYVYRLCTIRMPPRSFIIRTRNRFRVYGMKTMYE